MSEPESPYIQTLFQLHLRTKRTREEIAIAFLDTFSSASGRIVLEAMLDGWGLTQMKDKRAMGKHDALLEVLDAMARGEMAKNGHWTGRHDRTHTPGDL